MQTFEIVELARLLGSPCRKIRGEVLMSCPNAAYSVEHRRGDKNPSFEIRASDAASVCYCFTCGMTGPATRVFQALFEKGAVSRDVWEYVRDVERCDLAGFVRRLQRRREFTGGEEQKAFDLFRFAKKCSLNRAADDYLFSRGLTAHEIEKYHLGFDPSQRRVIFPFVSVEGVWSGASGRALFGGQVPKYYRYPSVDDSVLFGEEFVDWTDTRLYLVEGPMDAIKCRRALGGNVLALGGLTLPDATLRRILRIADEVTLVLDGDEAGYRGFERIGDKLCRLVRVFGVVLPGGKDPDTMDAKELRELVLRREIYHKIF